MKHYKIIWDNQSASGMFPLSAEFVSIAEVFSCLMSMRDIAINVDFDEDDLIWRLADLYNGDMQEYSGEGFSVVAVSER